MTCTRVRRDVIECSRAATMSTPGGFWVVTDCPNHDRRKLNGGCPTRCQSSVSMWHEGPGGFSGEVNAGKVLNRMCFDPAPPVMRSRRRIIEARRAALVVTIGTYKFGNPKCVR